MGKETQDRPPQKKKKEKQEKGQAAEPKTVGGIKVQTPREKRLQIRAERTDKVQAGEGTPKATTAKSKEKAPPAKQAKTVKIVSIGSPKTASTGRQKIVSTGLSTGSLKTEQQREKSPEILAREVVTMLATLSTSPKQKEKQNKPKVQYAIP